MTYSDAQARVIRARYRHWQAPRRHFMPGRGAKWLQGRRSAYYRSHIAPPKDEANSDGR